LKKPVVRWPHSVRIDRGSELKAGARRSSGATKPDEEGDVLAKIAEMPEPDRTIAQRR